MNIAIITGASSGLGMEFAMQLDEALHNVDEFWLIARREERLEELAEKLQHSTRIFPMDVTDDAALASLQEELERKTAEDAEERKPYCIRMLINCAGFGILGDFAELSLEEQLGMLDVNCASLTKITYMCIPYMKKNSRIIQLASSAAFLPQQGFAVYAATKSYVLSFSRAIGEELRKRGIYVTSVCPGPVSTEFFDIAEKHHGRLSVKNLTMVEAEDVVRDALRASAMKKPVAVYSPLIRAFWILTKFLPHSLMLAVMRLLGK